MDFMICPGHMAGTMIRHGDFGALLAIDSLTPEMRQSSLHSALIATICCTSLLAPTYLTTFLTAIALAAITAFAYKEYGTTIGSTTKAKPQTIFRHGWHNLNFLSSHNKPGIDIMNPRNHACGVDDVECVHSGERSNKCTF